MGVGALLVNCIPPDHVDGMVSYLRDFTDLPLGVYPEPRLLHRAPAGAGRPAIGGEEYAEMALRWRAEGAQIIGGCCGARPEHIAAARDALRGTRPGRERPAERAGASDGGEPPAPGGAAAAWTDRRGRAALPARRSPS